MQEKRRWCACIGTELHPITSQSCEVENLELLFTETTGITLDTGFKHGYLNYIVYIPFMGSKYKDSNFCQKLQAPSVQSL